MSAPSTHSKRPYNRNGPKGKGKWQKTAAFTSQHLRVPPGTTFFRVLCPISKGGSVIGKGGGIISQIRQESGAKVRVEDTVPGCDERIITIVESDEEIGVGSDQRKENDKKETDATDAVDKADEKDEGGKDIQSLPVEDSQLEKGPTSAQRALLLVFERIAEGESVINEESDKSLTFSFRLLVLSTQVSCLLGEGGSLIEKMSAESGAEIRILPVDKLPLCASSHEIVQISGGPDAVRKALLSVSLQLLENPPQDDEFLPVNPNGPSSHSFGHPFPRPEAHSPPNYPFPYQGPPYSAGPHDGKSGPLGRLNPPQDILTFRLLCPDEKVGGVIGKGGTIVKALEHESGCEIKVLERVPDSEDRVIVISGPAHPDERISAAQDAVLRVQTRIVRATPESKENTVTAKVLASSHQIGCLLGRGGSIIAEMRKSTGAYIRLLEKYKFPIFASENGEVVQIKGEFDAVQEALLEITSRLRDRFFREAFPSINHSFPDQGPLFPPYMGRRELSPPGMYSKPGPGPSFHKFDAGSLPPYGGFHPHDDHPPFMHDIHRRGFPPHFSEGMPTSAPWGPQGPSEGGPIGFPDYAGGPQRRIGGFGGGSQQAIITNTTIEVVVPSFAVPAIYGEDGGCLKQIREISDASITVADPKPGAAETAITISGTPEQTHAAQSLIQAFVISESEAS